MKTKLMLVLCVVSLSLFSFISLKQDVETAVASYDGFEYDMYSFSISGGDDEADIVIAFNEISEEILKAFDFKSNKLVGQDFEISFEIVTSSDKELDDDELEKLYVLKSLKKVTK